MQRSEHEIDDVLQKLLKELAIRGVTANPSVLMLVLQMAYSVGYVDGNLDAIGARKIDMLDLSGKHIRSFKSLKAAANYLNSDNCTIRSAIQNRGKSGGYRFKYHENKKY